MSYVETISKVLPVILLFLLGFLIKQINFLKVETMQELKKLVINITLPLALFLAFANAQIQPVYLIISGITFLLCIIILILGRGLNRKIGGGSSYFPPLLTGFEAGMMGYAVYSSVYGAENIFKFAIVDIGQVTFVFFILVSLLESLRSGKKPILETAAGFIKTPVIIAIILGILVNQSGMMPVVVQNPLANSLIDTFKIISSMTTPLIAMIIGFEMKLQKGNLFQPFKTILIRLALWIPLALLVVYFVVNQWLGLDKGFAAAVLTMYILPPPFVIPLFIDPANTKDRTYVNNTLSLSVLASLIVFVIISVVLPPG